MTTIPHTPRNDTTTRHDPLLPERSHELSEPVRLPPLLTNHGNGGGRQTQSLQLPIINHYLESSYPSIDTLNSQSNDTATLNNPPLAEHSHGTSEPARLSPSFPHHGIEGERRADSLVPCDCSTRGGVMQCSGVI